MDKRNLLKLLLATLLIVLLGFGYVLNENDVLQNDKTTEDEHKFKQEYESLNGKTREGKEYKNMEIRIPKNNHVVYASKKQILDILENGTGIIYFGFPDCPWCRNVVPVLIETIKEENVKEVYYYNAREERDEKRLTDGKIEEVKKGSSFYRKVLKELGTKASSYDGLDDENIKRLYFPTILFIKDGEVVLLHEGTVSSQTDPLIKLNKKQKEELKYKLIEGINLLYGDVCDDKC